MKCLNVNAKVTWTRIACGRSVDALQKNKIIGRGQQNDREKGRTVHKKGMLKK